MLAGLQGVHIGQQQFSFAAQRLKLLGALPFFAERVQLALVSRSHIGQVGGNRRLERGMSSQGLHPCEEERCGL